MLLLGLMWSFGIWMRHKWELDFPVKQAASPTFALFHTTGVLVGPDAQPFASTVFPVVMGPGSEGLWLYPQCHRELFLQRQYVVNF